MNIFSTKKNFQKLFKNILKIQISIKSAGSW